MRKLAIALALVPAFSGGPILAQEAATPSGLPGGAASLSEEHGDWTVSCQMQGAEKLCALSQALASSTTGERVLALELATPSLDQIEGMLLLPFGLRFSDGVTLRVDTNPLGAARPFLTCIATGCLVPVAFTAGEVSAMRSGKEMTIAAASADAGQPVELTVSLTGFSMASNRSVELSN